MSPTVIPYDHELPQIEGHDPSTPPAHYLRRSTTGETEFEIVEGRRPSTLLLVNSLRTSVNRWRGNGYPGAAGVTKRLLTYWFEEDHLVEGELFRFYFGQREAAETLIYLAEVRESLDAGDLVRQFGDPLLGTLLHPQPEVYTTTEGQRRVFRRFEEGSNAKEGEQDLPPEDLPRFAFKMATGSGKTVVMAMLVAWSYFHKKCVPGSALTTNFLVLAPNVIVYERLEKDFASNRIFRQMPIIPPDLDHDFQLKAIMRGESVDPSPSGNVLLTNIQQLRDEPLEKEPVENAVQRLLGPKPAKDLSSYGRSSFERIVSLPNLAVINDEAHHVHDEKLAWTKTLMSIHQRLPAGLSLWLDFSATPKDQNGNYYPWCVVDYPLQQAIEDRIVKAPLIVDRVRATDPGEVTADDIADRYGPWLRSAVDRWRAHEEVYKAFEPAVKPVLFIMAEKNALADALWKWLITDPDIGLTKEEVLLIHTDTQGEVRKGDLEGLREAARDVDKPDSPYKVIVSVMMLKEGWDVRNVTVVLGLRPFSAKAQILPEQAVGRGLRLIQGVSPDSTQTLEVMGTPAFEEFVQRMETEGTLVARTDSVPPAPVTVAPVTEKKQYDIAIPLTKPSLHRTYRNIDSLDVMALEPIWDRPELPEPMRIDLRFRFPITDTQVHTSHHSLGRLPLEQELVTMIVNDTIARAKLDKSAYERLYEKVRDYLGLRALGQQVDLGREDVRDSLRNPEIRGPIAAYLAAAIGRLTLQREDIEFENPKFRLSNVTPFLWRRKHTRLEHTIFNYVAAYNDFEVRFAEFLDKAKDVARFASLGTTEQGSGATFKIDYVKLSGARGFYYPDWVVVQTTGGGEVSWIVETKGRVWPGTENKDAAVTEWCRAVSEQTGQDWRYLRVNQIDFERINPTSFFGFSQPHLLLGRNAGA